VHQIAILLQYNDLLTHTVASLKAATDLEEAWLLLSTWSSLSLRRPPSLASSVFSSRHTFWRRYAKLAVHGDFS
jgi:hypothetical protein